MSTESTQPAGVVASQFRLWAELAGAWAISFAWPVFQGTTSGPDALTGSRVDPIDLLSFSLMVLLIAPTILWLLGNLITRFTPEGGKVFHAGAIGLLLGLVVWQALNQGEAPLALSLAVLFLVSTAISMLYLRTAFMRTMAGLLSIGVIVVFAGLWLSSPAWSLLKGPPTSKAASANGVPVVMVVMDEFPIATVQSGRKRIDPRFSNFARLSRQGTWYRNAMSVADVTTVALPAILAGERGEIDAPPAASEYPENLFTLLGGAGYSISSHEEVTDLCPHDVCTDRGEPTSRFASLLLNGIENGRPVPEPLAMRASKPLESFAYKLTPRPQKVAEKFIADLEGGQNRLSFVHLMLPHVPWRMLPDGRSYEAPLAPGLDLEAGDKSVPWAVPQSEINSSYQRQQLQLAYTDQQLGRIVARMKKLGSWDESMFVVVADHGASFRKGLYRRHLNEANSGWILPVPLFIKYPGQTTGRIDSRPADLLDILPTILDETSVEDPRTLEGRSLLDSPLAEPDITAESTAEGTITLARQGVADVRNRAVTQRTETFENGSPWAMAGKLRLIGKSVEQIPGLRRINAAFDAPWPRTAIVPGSRSLPAYVTGTIEPKVKPEAGLILSLNGSVAGTLKPWADGASKRFAFTLPPGLFQAGVNRVELFSVVPNDRQGR